MRMLWLFVPVDEVVCSGAVRCRLDTVLLVRLDSQVVFLRIVIVSLLLVGVFWCVVVCDQIGRIGLDVWRVLMVVCLLVLEFVVWLMLMKKQVLVVHVVVDCVFLFLLVVMF